jgi:plasmid maintenance system antidote protein VapI
MADADKEQRARAFREQLAATGLSITEFQRDSGLTRNVVYNLSKGQKPSSAEQAQKLEEAFGKLKKP